MKIKARGGNSEEQGALAGALEAGLIQTVLDSLSAHIAVLDASGVIIAVNEAWARFASEKPPGEPSLVPGVNYLDLCRDVARKSHAEEDISVAEGLQCVLEGDLATFSTQYACPSPHEERWFSMTVRPLGGGRKGAVVTHEDISEFRRQGVQAQRTGLRWLRQAHVVSLFASSPALTEGEFTKLATTLTAAASEALEVERVGVWLFEAHGASLLNLDTFDSSRGTHVSGALFSQEDYPREFAQLRNAKFVNADDARSDPRLSGFQASYLQPHGVGALLQAVIRSGERLWGVLFFEHVGGPRHWEHDEWSFACQLADQLALVLSNHERRRMELALQESAAIFRNLFENHSAVKLIIDPVSSRIIDANAAAVAFYGWSVAELRKMCIQQINTLSPAEIEAEMAKARASRSNTFEFRHRRADGSIRDVEVFCNNIGVGGRDLLYSIIHDITERKQAEQTRKLLEERDRRLEKSESLNRMAGAIAHHFNNQLQAVMMSQELSLNDLADDAKAREYLSMAQLSAREAARVSSLMLTYLGQDFVRHEPLDLSATCSSALDLLKLGLPDRVSLDCAFPGEGPTVCTSAEQIHQILSHLLANASEACGPGPSTVRLRLCTVSGAQIPEQNRFPVSFTPTEESYACLEIADNGCGIRPQQVEKLFEPFYTTKFDSRGLGLPVVLGIVRGHQGGVCVESMPGRGSVFRVYLPVCV